MYKHTCIQHETRFGNTVEAISGQTADKNFRGTLILRAAQTPGATSYQTLHAHLQLRDRTIPDADAQCCGQVVGLVASGSRLRFKAMHAPAQTRVWLLHASTLVLLCLTPMTL